MSEALDISEIFLSIQGEGTRAGRPCAILRLAGCNLRCAWCDTRYAWTAGRGQESPSAAIGGSERMTVDEVLGEAARLGCPLVEVTGGEPLAQPATIELLARLADVGFETLLETNGSMDIAPVDPRVARIVDFKCPSSGQSRHNLWSNVSHLTVRDEVKFVLADRADFDFATEAVARHELPAKCCVIFQPVAGMLDPARLADWILTKQLGVRLGLQLHKIIWPGKERGV